MICRSLFFCAPQVSQNANVSGANRSGAKIAKLSIIVPAGIEVTTQEDLSGPKSLARKGVKEGDWENFPFTPADKSTMAEMQRRDEQWRASARLQPQPHVHFQR